MKAKIKNKQINQKKKKVVLLLEIIYRNTLVFVKDKKTQNTSEKYQLHTTYIFN